MPVNSSSSSAQSCQSSWIPAHAKGSDNNDNGGSSESNTDTGDDNENGKLKESLVVFLTENIPNMRPTFRFYDFVSHGSVDTPDTIDSSTAEDDTFESDRLSKRQKVCCKPELEKPLTRTKSTTVRTGGFCAG